MYTQRKFTETKMFKYRVDVNKSFFLPFAILLIFPVFMYVLHSYCFFWAVGGF